MTAYAATRPPRYDGTFVAYHNTSRRHTLRAVTPALRSFYHVDARLIERDAMLRH